MKGLTSRQAQILELIGSSVSERGYPPTIREIGRAMGIRSTNGVNDHLRALERKGHLKRDDLRSRGLSLLKCRQPRSRHCPELSAECAHEAIGILRGAAGRPLSADETDAVCDLLTLLADSYTAAARTERAA